MYKSVTAWETAGPYIVHVHTGAFKSEQQALNFGSQPMRLLRKHDFLILQARASGHILDEADESSVHLFKIDKLLSGCIGLFRRLSIPIAQYGTYPELCEFKLLTNLKPPHRSKYI